MKRIFAAITFLICLTAFLVSCTKLEKTVPPLNTAAIQNNGDNTGSDGKTNAAQTPAPTAAPTPTPTAAPTPSPAVTPAPKDPQPVLSEKLPTSTKYVILVDISDQKVYVYKNGSIIRTMICSTGLPGKDTETPVGNFHITKYRGTFFYNSSSDVQEGAKYWVGFIGANFLFHSVPTDKNGNILQDEAEKLGTPASHGCVRMSMDNAKWFYETIPTGSNVIIQK